MTTVAPTDKPLAIRFGLRYPDIAAALNDIGVLRRGYEQSGNWSLPQIAWHLLSVMTRFLSPAALDATQTPEQAERLAKFHDTIAKPGGGSTFPAGSANTPPASCEDTEIDRLVEAFERLQDFASNTVDLGPFGATPLELVRRLHLIHAAHHLSFLAPRGAKRSLHFDDFPAVIAEVERLRFGGYVQIKRWNLEQMSFHLAKPILVPLQAVPASPAPTVDLKLAERFQHYADHDAPLPGITAPPGSEPAHEPPDGTVDELIKRLRAADAFDAEYVDLGPRGPMFTRVYKPFLRGHCAHHLSYLLPLSPR